ncbi:hypothetical protein BDZ45DRAFT_364360 [Acephala macrosclerotiorum]|nr:hypothetical protein BDZ45DRAFT_364360 [Acephala macrosclerotiorum]
MPTGQRRFKKQAFGAAKDAKTKALIKRNATTSPLLKLPLELRQRIWGYVLGHQLVHLTEEPFNLKYGNVVSPDRRWRWFHTVCQSTTTEREAYELSRSEEYDKSASEMNEGEDMRFCRNRHVACFKALKDADRHNRPPNKLHIELLSVCRQAYIEANPILWSTTIWSPWGYCNWRRWCDIRTPLQRQLIKKVHLDTNVVHDYVHKTNISLFANWKELYVDVTVNRSTYKHTILLGRRDICNLLRDGRIYRLARGRTAFG